MWFGKLSLLFPIPQKFIFLFKSQFGHLGLPFHLVQQIVEGVTKAVREIVGMLEVIIMSLTALEIHQREDHATHTDAQSVISTKSLRPAFCAITQTITLVTAACTFLSWLGNLFFSGSSVLAKLSMKSNFTFFAYFFYLRTNLGPIP